jgi:hypothetical protein
MAAGKARPVDDAPMHRCAPVVKAGRAEAPGDFGGKGNAADSAHGAENADPARCAPPARCARMTGPESAAAAAMPIIAAAAVTRSRPNRAVLPINA